MAATLLSLHFLRVLESLNPGLPAARIPLAQVQANE
jgi:hypothetical protein